MNGTFFVVFFLNHYCICFLPELVKITKNSKCITFDDDIINIKCFSMAKLN